jgi:hypothetical protein
MPKHHIIISGTGRAGTTFLVQLLTELELDTGFPDTQSQIYSNCNAGMELDIRQPNAPYIIKSPWLCDDLDEVLCGGDIVVDHAIIPVRDLYSAAQSRRYVASKADPNLDSNSVPGGLWHTEEPGNQELILVEQLYKLVHALAKHEVPLTLLIFPKLVNDSEYLYRQIGFILGNITYDTFFKAFQKVSKPQLVHDFKKTGSKNNAT